MLNLLVIIQSRGIVLLEGITLPNLVHGLLMDAYRLGMCIGKLRSSKER